MERTQEKLIVIKEVLCLQIHVLFSYNDPISQNQEIRLCVSDDRFLTIL